MSTHETYVSLETAKFLKQARFDWECDHYYHCYTEKLCKGKMVYGGDYLAPTLSVAQKWLREVKGYEVEPYLYVPPEYVNVEPEPWDSYTCDITIPSIRNYGTYDLEDFFKTYEEALEAGIKKCLEIILEKE